MSEQNDRGEPVRIDLAELKRLEAAATPGEWHSADYYVCVTKPNGLPGLIIICPFSKADAALIAAARNALPALIAMSERVQELERENAALRAAEGELSAGADPRGSPHCAG